MAEGQLLEGLNCERLAGKAVSSNLCSIRF